jgi:hypothetical protein
LAAKRVFWSEFIGISCTRMLSGAVRAGTLGAATAVAAGEELVTVAESETVGVASEDVMSGELSVSAADEGDGVADTGAEDAGAGLAASAAGGFPTLCKVGDPGKYCNGWMFCHAR